MSRAAPKHPRATTAKANPEEGLNDDEADKAADKIPEQDEEDELADELAEESGLDLTDASDLDADNVPADEEFDRVMQAPD